MLKERIIYLLFLAGCVAFYLFFNDYISFVSLVLMAVLPVLIGIINCIAGAFVKVKFSNLRSDVQSGSDAKIKLIVTNKSFFDIPNAKLIIIHKNEFEGEEKRESIIFPIHSMSDTTIETNLVSIFCGNVTVCVKKIKLYDLLGLTAFHKALNLKKTIVVLPKVYNIQNNIAIHVAYDDESHEYSNTKSGDDVSQIFDFHEYRDGDKMKNVHWKLSTKLDKFMVKELSLPLSNTVCIGIELNDEKNSHKRIEVLDAQFRVAGSIYLWLLANEISQTTLWHDTKTHCNTQLRIENIESMMLGFSSAYAVKPYVGNYVISEIAGSTNKPNYTHFIYITGSLNDEMVNLLSKFKEQVSVSVVLVKHNESVPDSLLLNELSKLNISITALSTKSLENDIQKIMLV